MNAQLPDDAFEDDADSELRRTIVDHFGLSDMQLARIHAMRQANGLGFTDAAVRLGILTQQEVAEVLDITTDVPYTPATEPHTPADATDAATGVPYTPADESYAAPEALDTAIDVPYTPADVPHTATEGVPPAQASRPDARESTLFETAIRRISSDRRIVLREGEPVRPSAKLILAYEPDNPRSEKLRALRTELLLLDEGGRGANIVPILSAGAGEGRSLLCAELAISFAQLGRRTLLVDADMRRPQQHVLFDSTNEHGLSEAVAHNQKPYFHPVIGLPPMHLLTAGPVPPNPLELLSDGRFAGMLNQWRNTYEFIVIDTPPVNQCADALAIATMAGRVMVVSRARQSTFKDTRELLRRLGNTQSRILGAVINHF